MKRKYKRFFSVTRTGWIFILLIAVIFSVAVLKGLNLIYLIASFMISFMFVSSILALIGLFNISIERIIPSNIFAEKSFPIDLRLTNNKRRFSTYSITINDILQKQELSKRYIIKIPPKMTISAGYEHTLPRRGVYQFDGVRISTMYPFDFFRRGYIYRKEDKIIVYPKIVKLNPNFLADLMTEVEMHLNRPGFGSEIYGFRKYQYGDDTRDINWKITAKTSEVVLTKFSQEQNLHMVIVFDNVCEEQNKSNEKGFKLEWFESAVTFVASISSFFIEKGFKVKLITQSDETGFGEGTKHLFQVLGQLAVIEPVLKSQIKKDLYNPAQLEQKLGLLITCSKEQQPIGHFTHVFHAKRISKL